VVRVHDISDEPVELVERVCAIDIGKSALMACVRVPHKSRPGRRAQEVRELGTTTGELLGLADWLRCQQVELVAMEATSDYWKSVFYLLESQGLRCWLLNAKHVKNVPGRPKTDKLDAVWLAKVVERGMCRPSLVHPRPIRQLRDLTRYRRSWSANAAGRSNAWRRHWRMPRSSSTPSCPTCSRCPGGR
jgi:transposase